MPVLRALHASAAPAGKVVSISELDDYEKEITKKMVVVDFTATWCGPCKKIAPVFESLAAQNTDVRFVKVDVDKAPDVATKEAIQSVPSFLFFKVGAPK